MHDNFCLFFFLKDDLLSVIGSNHWENLKFLEFIDQNLNVNMVRTNWVLSPEGCVMFISLNFLFWLAEWHVYY